MNCISFESTQPTPSSTSIVPGRRSINWSTMYVDCVVGDGLATQYEDVERESTAELCVKLQQADENAALYDDRPLDRESQRLASAQAHTSPSHQCRTKKVSHEYQGEVASRVLNVSRSTSTLMGRIRALELRFLFLFCMC